MEHCMKGLVISGLSLLVACATASAPNGPNEPPESWLSQFDGKNAQCRDFEQIYSNEGEREKSSDKKAYSVYLSELMFSRLPGGQLPHSLSLATDSKSGQLSVTLMGDMRRDLQYTVDCRSGWHVLNKTSTGQYLGDGVVEKQYGQVSFFRIGDRDELIVRVLVDAEFNSMYVFDSSVHADEWYRFWPVSSRD